MITTEEIFWSKVDIRGPDECWEWQAGKTGGYGEFHIGAEIFYAHRSSSARTIPPYKREFLFREAKVPLLFVGRTNSSSKGTWDNKTGLGAFSKFQFSSFI